MATTVYAITTHVRLADGGWSNRQVDAVIAAPSKSAAARAIGVSASMFGKYASVGAGGEWAAAAMSEPGTVFVRPAGSYGQPFVRLSEMTR